MAQNKEVFKRWVEGSVCVVLTEWDKSEKMIRGGMMSWIRQ